jgi:hypothetical protein
MSQNSPNLALPYLLAAQAQKHVTVNEALRILDALVQLSVLEARAAPPASPAAGLRYLVTATATGEWAGWEGSIALRDDTAWRRLIPQKGWLLFNVAASQIQSFDGAEWIPFEMGADIDFASGEIEALGVATEADETNRLAVASPAVLLTHDGAGHQLKINKAALGDTASLLFQTGFSGRAEMGLAGEDDYSFKVSPDGAAWLTALRILAATGRVQLPLGVTVNGLIDGTAVTQSETDATGGRLLKVGDFGMGASLQPYLADLNAADRGGIYGYSDTSANVPPFPFGTVIHAQRLTNRKGQIAVAAGAVAQRRMFFRAQNGDGWETWNEVFHKLNIVGAVSQASGVPTGAIIERGANANGTFIRFADGTQICTKLVDGLGPVDIAFGVFFRSALYSYGPWAATFAAPPQISASATASASGGFQIVWAAHARPPTASGPVEGCLLRGTTSSSTDFSMHFLAIGRWY